MVNKDDSIDSDHGIIPEIPEISVSDAERKTITEKILIDGLYREKIIITPDLNATFKTVSYDVLAKKDLTNIEVLLGTIELINGKSFGETPEARSAYLTSRHPALIDSLLRAYWRFDARIIAALKEFDPKK